MILYFHLVCFTFYILYSVLPFHIVYVFQFFQLFFFFFGVLSHPLSRVVEKLLYTYIWGFPGSSVVKKKKKKKSPCNAEDARDVGSIPGSRRSPGEGNGFPLQYSCLENSMNRGAWWALSGIKESDTTEWLTFSWCVCDCPVILIQVQQEVLVIVQTLPCSARRQPRARQLSRTTLAKETREAPSSIKTLHRSQPSTSFYLSIDGTCLLNKYLRSFTGSQVYCSSAMTCRVSANQSDPTEQLSTQTHTYT